MTQEGCIQEKQEIKIAYNEFRFDNKVVSRLSQYDSLAGYLRQEMKWFQQRADSNNSPVFSYLFQSEKTDQPALPSSISAPVNSLFKNIGPGYIYGFDIFHDTSIRIRIRKQSLGKVSQIAEENLSWLPEGGRFPHRGFPVKDTMLSPQWQYWVRIYTKYF